jgi:hypothetical protein
MLLGQKERRTEDDKTCRSELRTPVGISLIPSLSAASSVAYNQSAEF